jgi:hypothetical protein
MSILFWELHVDGRFGRVRQIISKETERAEKTFRAFEVTEKRGIIATALLCHGQSRQGDQSRAENTLRS